MSEKLVSTRQLREGLKDLEEQLKGGARFLTPEVARRDELLLLEFRRIVREAEVEYLSSSAASDLTGWDAGTLRKYAKKALAGEPMPEEWSLLTVRKDGKEYAYVLSSIPARARNAA
jgi:hypothetical protein